MSNVDISLSILIIFSLVGISFYLGYRHAKKKYAIDPLEYLFERLEREGYIRAKTDESGAKELVLISKIVAEELEKKRK